MPSTKEGIVMLSRSMTTMVGGVVPSSTAQLFREAAATTPESSAFAVPYSNTFPTSNCGTDSTDERTKVDVCW